MFTTIALSMRCFVIPLAELMSKSGYKMVLGCADDGKIASEIPADIEYLPLKIKRGIAFKQTVQCIWQLYRYFRKNKIQVVEYGTENVSFCASIAAWAARVPVRIYNHWGARYVGFTGLARKLSFMIERTIVIFSTTVRSCSAGNRQLSIADGLCSPNKCKVIGDGGAIGVDLMQFDRDKKSLYASQIRKQYGIGEQDFVFAYVGAIRKDKGTNELLSAFRKMSEEGRSAWLMMVGAPFEDDPIDENLYEWARNAQNVVFTDLVSDVHRYMAAADCLVHPSYREGFGMVIAEAGAMGVPSITTRILGASEVAGEHCWLVNKADVEDLKNRMCEVFDAPEQRRQMSERVFEYMNDHQDRTKVLQWHLEDRIQVIKEYFGE